MRTLEYRTNNGYDSVLLVEDGEVRSQWQVDDKVCRDFCDCSVHVDDWDVQSFVENQNPGDYGELVAVRKGYTLTAIDEQRWTERFEFICV